MQLRFSSEFFSEKKATTVFKTSVVDLKEKGESLLTCRRRENSAGGLRGAVNQEI